ncbi:MAG: LPS translocon maturation chaperone LptM [Methylobacter sp.]
MKPYQLLLPLLISAVVSGCGQTGPLYLPDQPPPIHVPPEPKPDPETQPEK